MNRHDTELVYATSRAVRSGAKYQIALAMLAELTGVPEQELDEVIDAEALSVVRDRLGLSGVGITKT